MNKSFRKNISNKPMISYSKYRKYYPKTVKVKTKKSKSFYRKLLGQLIVSILIVLIIILFKNIDSSVTKEVTASVKNALNSEYDYKNSLNKIKEYGIKIKDITYRSIPVFNSRKSGFEFVRPLDGVIVSSFGEEYDPITDKVHFQRGIDIQGVGIDIVKTIDDGVVEVVGESENLGKFIKINHTENIFSIYSNLNEIFVKENQRVLRGEKIGTVGKNNKFLLHFELWMDEKVVNPELYLEYDRAKI